MNLAVNKDDILFIKGRGFIPLDVIEDELNLQVEVREDEE